MTLVLLLAFFDMTMGPAPQSQAADYAPGVTLSGLLIKDRNENIIDSKTGILSSTTKTAANFRLTPNYSEGAASGIKVHLFLPWLEEHEGEYTVVSREGTPTELGLQGEAASEGVGVAETQGPVRGGELVMSYNGTLQGGQNPGFEVLFTSYNDGSTGPYGSVPEGTLFEVNGYVSYEAFNNDVEVTWETPNRLDDESRIHLISSDLEWEATIEAYLPEPETDPLPIWDRYQYITYEYAIKNTSNNLASFIEGYSITFGLDSVDSGISGIIPFDINRWLYNDGAPPSANTEPSSTDGQFVGVPGKGGILIYDVTDWDGESPLTTEIPYTYSGAGMISVDRTIGANNDHLAPSEERKFLISIPLSRQGFPILPTEFKVRNITNVLFVKTANWSKTEIIKREVVEPGFGA